jgi:hypothetical protein
MSEFCAGQVWSYTTRPGEEGSRLTVCMVESNDKIGSFVHIHVEGVAIGSRRTC